MPGFILHQGATVQCSHAGQAQPTTPSTRVLVSSQPITTQTPPYSVTGCPNPPNSGGPCVTATWSTAATRVLSMGLPVLLFDSMATCAPTGVPTQILQTQTRVMAQ